MSTLGIAIAKDVLLVLFDSLCLGETDDLDARRRRHEVDAPHELIVRELVAHNDDLVRLHLINPFSHDLTVNKARIDARKNEITHVLSPFLTCFSLPLQLHPYRQRYLR